MTVTQQTALAIAIGGVLIVGALLLLYTKKISLEKVAGNASLKDSEMKVEIANLISVGTNVPALGLFLTALVLIFLGLYFVNEHGKRDNDQLASRLAATERELTMVKDNFSSHRATLTVTGVVSKADSDSPQDVIVETRWPPFRLDANGKLAGLLVQRDNEGRLPVLGFVHSQYDPISIDLNTEATVEGSKVIIPAGSLVLRKLPGNGGRQ